MSPAANLENLIDRLDHLAPKSLKQYRIAGAALALVHQGCKVWGKGYGLANRETRTPVTQDTVFQVASISKTITAWAVMKLVEMGKLELDAPAANYLKQPRLPGKRYDTRELTIKRLLSHSAGLNQPVYPGYLPDEPTPTLQQVFSHPPDRRRMTTVINPPGSKFLYSDGDYALLQWIIEQVSGVDFPEFVHDAVLCPLGMHSSSFDPLPGIIRRMATSYNAMGKPLQRYQFVEKGAIGLHTTASDLATFISAWLPGPGNRQAGGGVLSPATLACMFSEVISLPGFERWIYGDGYGLGYFLEYQPNGIKLVSHLGGYLGWRADIVAWPEQGEGIVILTNSDVGHELFADVLNAWTEWLGIAPVRVARAIQIARRLVRLASVGAGLHAGRSIVESWQRARREAPHPASLIAAPPVLQALPAAIFSILGVSAYWAFLRPVMRADLPSVADWLTASVNLLGVAGLVRNTIGKIGINHG